MNLICLTSSSPTVSLLLIGSGFGELRLKEIKACWATGTAHTFSLTLSLSLSWAEYVQCWIKFKLMTPEKASLSCSCSQVLPGPPALMSHGNQTQCTFTLVKHSHGRYLTGLWCQKAPPSLSWAVPFVCQMFSQWLNRAALKHMCLSCCYCPSMLTWALSVLTHRAEKTEVLSDDLLQVNHWPDRTAKSSSSHWEHLFSSGCTFFFFLSLLVSNGSLDRTGLV